MEKENIRDYLNRLNGYARNANIKFENGGRNAREHVKHFLETCGDKDLERQLTPMQLRDIYTLEDVMSDILKVEKRVSGRESSKFSSRKDEERYGDLRNSYGRSDNRTRTHDRSRSESRSIRVTLADATPPDLISELQVRTPQEDVNDYSEELPACIDETIGYEQNESDAEYFSQEEAQIDDPYAAQDEGVVAAANHNEHRAAVNGTFARSDKRPQQGGTPPSGYNQGGYRPPVGHGMRFSDNRGGRGFSKPQYGPCAACGGLNHSTHYCFRRCKLCQQVHDAGQCEAFNELAKILRTKVDKNDISLELQKIVFAERVIDADCIYAFISKCNYPDEDNDYSNITQDGDEYHWGNERVIDADCSYKVISKGKYPDVDNDYFTNTTGLEKERGISLWRSACEMVKMVPDERMGWWSSKRFDQRVRMRAIVRGAVNDVRIPILLDTGANVSIISTRLAKRLRLQQIRGHGRQLEVQGIKKGKMSTIIRVAAKITLGWNTVYQFDF
ncbi:hypothetical protein PHMEG_00034697 [Phytophthora megakarya]|uniref:Peptidase A2 domain-containing protein n=1 Tax=Phytophthora megakarya TaxID=4795 RepID=A0A225UQT2_9STRA|nr:hypothetical protein PHMEG_00034697 [Phytophthora megakarya]